MPVSTRHLRAYEDSEGRTGRCLIDGDEGSRIVIYRWSLCMILNIWRMSLPAVQIMVSGNTLVHHLPLNGGSRIDGRVFRAKAYYRDLEIRLVVRLLPVVIFVVDVEDK